MRNFCTLFDKNYLYRGLALYSLLLKHSSNFTLWILCMDNTTHELLKKINLANVKLIKLEEFENERTATEHPWTCAANLCWYMLDKTNRGELITYNIS